MAIAEEVLQLNDCFLVDIDIENCPMAEIPLTDMFDMVTFALFENYRDTIRETVVQMLEDTPWTNATSRATLLDAGFGIYHVRNEGMVISLQQAALQRLIAHSIAVRETPVVTMQIPITIRFLLSDVDMPTPPKVSIDASDAGSQRSTNRSGPPSNVSESELLDHVSELPGPSPVPQIRGTPAIVFGEASTSIPDTTGNAIPSVKNAATFRGRPVNVDRPNGPGPPGRTTMRREDFDSHEGGSSGGHGGGVPTQPRRGPLFDHHPIGHTPLGRTPTRSHPYSAEVKFGAESFEDYMTQFMYSEVRFKDFRKAVNPKYDSSRN